MQSKNLVKAFLLLLISCSCTSKKPVWSPLFNGKDLKGWDTWLGPRYDSTLKKWDTIPIGLNIDPDKVFDVVMLGDELVIRISGEDFGGISTTGEFENYHLQLQFKWGELKWPPNKKEKKDSGLLYDAVGPQGADGGNWMKSHEFQIEEGDCGDYWGCAGATSDIKAKKNENNEFVYDRKGDLATFSASSPNGRHCIKFPDSEKPAGEWNTIDLYCFEGTSIHIVNGVVNMILHNSRQPQGDTEIPLTKGKIQIQSEGSEILYRHIKICPIDKLPRNLME